MMITHMRNLSDMVGSVENSRVDRTMDGVVDEAPANEALALQVAPLRGFDGVQ